jgi:hypothetical protein
LGKTGREDAKLLERVVSYFSKKLRMRKLGGKLLKMLLVDKIFGFGYSRFVS